MESRESKRQYVPFWDRLTLPEGYEIADGYPEPEEYCNLRQLCGLRPLTAKQADVAMEGAWYGVKVTLQSTREVVAMGRVVGDGGWFFSIVDVCVHPQHQGC